MKRAKKQKQSYLISCASSCSKEDLSSLNLIFGREPNISKASLGTGRGRKKKKNFAGLMNRGLLQTSPVQQLMAGKPNWWNVNSMVPPAQQPSPLLPSSSSSSSSSPSSSSSSSLFPPYPPAASLPLAFLPDHETMPESWSQLLLGGLADGEDRCSFKQLQTKKMENWEDLQLLFPFQVVDVKQQSSQGVYPHGHENGNFQAVRSSWNQNLPGSSPRSSLTGFSSNILDFSNGKGGGMNQQEDHSSECNSTAKGSAFKKARIQSSPSQSTFKVRKEKLGDRVTALHQLVSPFGKTDTASVLLEAIGYIRFLQNQIEALSSPYLGSAPSATPHPNGEGELPKKDLRSRGLCLVPVSCTLQVGSDNGADYWAPALGGFR